MTSQSKCVSYRIAELYNALNMGSSTYARYFLKDYYSNIEIILVKHHVVAHIQRYENQSAHLLTINNRVIEL